ncbi:MAG: hypothetical protein SV760_07650 [Halobacteria archaeon]|nr:hypothetical protein [Halobacteria archaeon]
MFSDAVDLIKGGFLWVFEKIFDFVVGGGLKKTLIALGVATLIGLTVGYILYPSITTSLVMNLLGMTPEGEFKPPAVEGDTVKYRGTWQGTAGIGQSVAGKVIAEVNYETNTVSACMWGTTGKVSKGFFTGTVMENGKTTGTGMVQAFGLAAVKFRIEGEYTQDASSASGSWVSTTNMDGQGTWEIHRVKNAEFQVGKNSKYCGAR